MRCPLANKTNISWTNATWNPVTGCTKVSPGCANCYAEVIDHRFDHDKIGKLAWAMPLARGGRGVQTHPDRLDIPLKWRRGRKIFTCSISDPFHEDVPDYFLADYFGAMAVAHWHIFQVLTKRYERMQEVLSDPIFYEAVEQTRHKYGVRWPYAPDEMPWPLPNIWLGVSVENQLWANRRIPALIRTPAVIHYISAEPLLAHVNLEPWIPIHRASDGFTAGTYRESIDWVIDGGESGPGRRPADPDWFRSIRDQCRITETPYFHKQGNAFRPGQDRVLDGETYSEFPEEKVHALVGAS